MSDRTSHRRRDQRDSEFLCRRCRRGVSPDPYGSRHRNHCSWCLWSVHVDENPGDRASTCGGLLEPIAVWVKQDGEWAVVHRCTICGQLKTNRIAGDDNPWSLIALAAKALSQPPFPLESGMCTQPGRRAESAAAGFRSSPSPSDVR